MTSQHQFGGSWTEEKLDRIRKYLAAYTTIFTQNSRAATYRTIYVDAFAGTGYRTASSQPASVVENDTNHLCLNVYVLINGPVS